MREVAIYVESVVGTVRSGRSAAWAYDLDLWGCRGQGPNVQGAIDDLVRQCAEPLRPVVTERIEGDERAFRRDFQPCTEAERRTTLHILARARPATLELVRSLSDAALDWDDPERELPDWARWRTIRQLAWHIVNTESRYYLPECGLGYRAPATDGTFAPDGTFQPLHEDTPKEVLEAELDQSYDHVRNTVETIPADVVCADHSGTWTTVKMLRRLAWHERGELVVMERLARKAIAALER